MSLCSQSDLWMDDPSYNAVHNSETSCDDVVNDEMYDRLYHLKRVRLPRIIMTRNVMRFVGGHPFST